MAFIPSKDLIDAGRSIYLYGAVGGIVQMFDIRIEKIPGIEVPLPKDAAFSVAGLLGIVVLFRFVTFVLRFLIDLTAYRVETETAALKELSQTPSIQKLEWIDVPDPGAQPLADRIRQRIRRLGMLGHHSAFLYGITEVVLPSVFAGAILTLLWSPAWVFLAECTRRLVGSP